MGNTPVLGYYTVGFHWGQGISGRYWEANGLPVGVNTPAKISAATKLEDYLR